MAVRASLGVVLAALVLAGCGESRHALSPREKVAVVCEHLRRLMPVNPDVGVAPKPTTKTVAALYREADVLERLHARIAAALIISTPGHAHPELERTIALPGGPHAARAMIAEYLRGGPVALGCHGAGQP